MRLYVDFPPRSLSVPPYLFYPASVMKCHLRKLYLPATVHEQSDMALSGIPVASPW